MNISTLCVLHNIELSARYCDYLYAMKQGRIMAEGAPNKLITKETIRTIYDVESEIYTNPITQDLAVAFLTTRYRYQKGQLHKEKIQVQQPLYGYMPPATQKRSP